MSRARRVVVASEAGISIHSVGDVTDAVGACLGEEGLLLTEEELARGFFDLRNGLAGELFQKFVNYGLRLAIVLPDPEGHGERIRELVYEHSSHRAIRFFRSRDEAAAWLHQIT